MFITNFQFGVPIYSSFSDNEKQNKIQKEITIVFNKLLKNNNFKSDFNYYGHLISDLKFEENIIEKYKLINFSKCIKEHIDQFLQKIKFTSTNYLNYKITSSWLTLTKKGMYARAHTHGNADISGVYYFKTNENDGKIFFNNPNQMISNSICFSHIDQSIYFQPVVGKFILFPGWLQHGVQTNTTDNDRVSLSFNIHFNR